jgi:hypothetical protein
MGRLANVQDGLARLRWGDHVCHLFDQAEDLGELLVPYFKVGLERNEACLWVTSSPYGTDKAVSEMCTAMSGFDQRMAAGQIQIVGYDEWYTRQGALSAAETIRNWMRRKDDALAAGYAGLRITGNTSFLDAGMWDDFVAYERALDVALRGQPILTLCSYCKAKHAAEAVLDVMCAHGFSLRKHRGHWDLLDFHPRGSASTTPHDRIHGASPRRRALRTIVEDQLAEFMAPEFDRVALEGADVELAREQTTRFALIVQELIANASRHGALSSPNGKVAVQWRLSTNGSRRIYVKWVETGMSDLTFPDKVGFGTQLIARLAENYERLFTPEGMTCTFELDLSTA